MPRHFALHASPLPLQFWLLGLDARDGSLVRRGFRREPQAHLQGSSIYRLGVLRLHSSGLWVDSPRGLLVFQRRPHRFFLEGRLLTAAEGLACVRPYLLEHEAWVVRTLGASWRSQQLAAHRLPPPIRRSVPHWHAWQAGDHGLSAMLWQVPVSGPMNHPAATNSAPTVLQPTAPAPRPPARMFHRA